MTTAHTLGPLVVGRKYNWRNQPERLAYMGIRHYPGDGRTWHQFEKVDAPGIVWSEVLDADLQHFEVSEAVGGSQTGPAVFKPLCNCPVLAWEDCEHTQGTKP